MSSKWIEFKKSVPLKMRFPIKNLDISFFYCIFVSRKTN